MIHKIDLIRQADDLYLRLASLMIDLNWEHTPDYSRKAKRLTRLLRKANKRVERRLYAAEAKL